MFNEYYFTESQEEPVYFSIITLNNAVETSLYKGKQLVRRNSLQRGIHLLQKDNISLKVHIKWFKAIPELKIDNNIVEPVKLKRKELRNKLEELNYFNELNPKVLPKEPFKISSLTTPAILLGIGILWQVLTNHKGKLWEIPSMILFFITSIYLFGSLIDKVPERYMDSTTKGKYKFLIGMAGMISTQIILSKLITILR